MRRVARFRLRHLERNGKRTPFKKRLRSAGSNTPLVEKGRDVEPLVQKIAEFATRRVRCGASGWASAAEMFCRRFLGNDHLVESIPLTEEDDADPLLIAALSDPQIAIASGRSSSENRRDEWLASVDRRRRRIANSSPVGSTRWKWRRKRCEQDENLPVSARSRGIVPLAHEGDA